MSKGKGSGFEREIAKELGLWWTGGERDDIFWRTSQSGGRATIRKRKGKSTSNQEGDLCAIDPIGFPLTNKVTIELKCGYNGWTIKEFVDTKNRKNITLNAFFEQSSREAKNQGKDCWWLITRQDRKEVLIFMNHKFWKWLYPQIELPKDMEYVIIKHHVFGPVYCVQLKRFFQFVKPELFK